MTWATTGRGEPVLLQVTGEGMVRTGPMEEGVLSWTLHIGGWTPRACGGMAERVLAEAPQRF